MTDTEDVSVGDILICQDKTNMLFRRECLVIYRSADLMALITDGLVNVFFFPIDIPIFTKQSLTASKGLSAEQRLMTEYVIKNWGPREIAKKFPEIIDQEKLVIGIEPGGEEVNMALSAKVPKKLAMFWREFQATLDLSRMIHNDIPEDTEKLAMEWMLLSILKVGPTIGIKEAYERRQRHDS